MYKYQRINPQLYPEIGKLYKLCFNLEVEQWRIDLKYDTRCYGAADIGYFAVTQQGAAAPLQNVEMAAYYGVFTTILTYDGKDYIVAQSGDTMTAPNHQKRGLFVKLALETFKLAQEEGLTLIFGFPNKNSYPGFKRRLNWSFAGSMQKFTLKGGRLPLAELAKRVKFIEPLYRRAVNRKLAKFRKSPFDVNLALFNKLAPLSGLNPRENSGLLTSVEVKGFVKKELFFFERALRKEENYLIELDGFLMLIKVDGQLIVGDIAAFEIKQLPTLLESLKSLAAKLWCSKVVITLSENHWLFEPLSKTITPEELMPIGFFPLHTKEEKHANHDDSNDIGSIDCGNLIDCSNLTDTAIDITKIQFVGADFDTF